MQLRDSMFFQKKEVVLSIKSIHSAFLNNIVEIRKFFRNFVAFLSKKNFKTSLIL